MPPTFAAPQYIKSTNPKTGALEQAYKFNIEFHKNDEVLSIIAESDADITLQMLQKCVVNNLDWWNNFINAFLASTTKYFSKPYTVDHINKIAKHMLNGQKPTDYPVDVSLTPSYIQISGGTFMIYWTYSAQKILINIPDLAESENNTVELLDLPVSNKSMDSETGIEELNIDDIAPADNSTEDILDLESSTKLYEKQRVKEAKLRARLAVYKAQRQIERYYEKYGVEVSDSDSDSDASEEESEEEEIQL
jgi:hypothetical protein